MNPCFGVTVSATFHLSPFQGFCHVIETPDSQAVTRDGLSWQINVKTVPRARGWSSFGDTFHRRAVLFGFWEKQRGIKRLPLNPLVSIDKIERLARPILGNIEKLSKGLPFVPTDDYELWLLDHSRYEPLVLLCSASGPPLAYPKRLRWHAAAMSDLSFIAPSLHAVIATDDSIKAHSMEPHRYLDAIERLIRDQSAPFARWYKRTETAAGIVVDAQGVEQDAALRLDKRAFPECLIRDDWDDPRDAGLVADYIRWQAPLLLQLRRLGSDTRQKLEILARQARQEVAKYHNLYPLIIDQSQINAALVEAVMKGARKIT